MKNKNNEKKPFFKPLGAIQKQKCTIYTMLGCSVLGVIGCFLASLWLGILSLALYCLLVYVCKCPVSQEKTEAEIKEKILKELNKN